ncbi:hypothetical protein [Cellulomonas rhizosphaerae]|uniref:Uncharacterized protein n=1 Tax=Cellulomonas rhizosphaerae TaxID=2293719 RepID=A0A413RH51_9CELL|nr:hypothetical protein [Cellulomonas rhizosphaerae]RHA37106.1 hypothetical protein D1825_17610 [Cellulomonas rhizosphaerae]
MAAILLLLVGANRGRVRRVAVRRRGWDVAAVWADESLGENLAALGIDRILPRAPAALVMAWSRRGVELWDGGRDASRLVRVDWRDVRSIDETPASCGTLAMHGVAISLVSGAQVVVCPSRRPTGGAGGASAVQVRVLAEHLRGFLGTSPLRR